jgi:hypothetical protein
MSTFVNKLILCFMLFSALGLSAQRGFEGIIVEEYYVSDKNDATDEKSGMVLPEGSTTYRIYADLAPEWVMQVVYGSPLNPLHIETTTTFFNHHDRGNAMGTDISVNRLPENTVALDSWITIGTACSTHHGVLKEEDTDGSIIGGDKNDGGSAAVKGGLLKNNAKSAGIPLTEADGMIPMKPERIVPYGLDFDELRFTKEANALSTDNGAWSVPGGVKGPTDSNRVLIAQLTTNGSLTFELNIQIRNIESGNTERWVAKNPAWDEFTHPSLTRTLPVNQKL